MKSLYENITSNEYKMLNTFFKNPNSCPADFFFSNPDIDGIVHELSNANLIELDENANISVTELGRSALNEYDTICKKHKAEHTFELLKFLIPVIISLISLGLSIVSIIMQL